MKKVISFDLDETLTETRTIITPEMAELISKLLEKYNVCIISGGSIDQFKRQFLSSLNLNSEKLLSLHLMPTCGTRYYNYSVAKKAWQQVYAEDFTNDEKQKITEALSKAIELSGYKVEKPKGSLIEDRGSQITYSALGQDAEPQEKKEWDPSGDKKKKVRNLVAKIIPQFEVRVGGTTSIDVTKLGIDKAYGMKKLMDILNLDIEEMLFIGDRIFEGGNDYPVKQMGMDTIAVGNYDHTPWVIRGILSVS